MTRTRLVLRSLAHHWRTHAAVMLGVLAASAAMTGALVVGDSMRASLRELALGRLGSVDAVLRSPLPLTGDYVRASRGQAGSLPRAAVLLDAAAESPETGRRRNRATILSIDELPTMFPDAERGAFADFVGRVAVINDGLAKDLALSVGDDILLRFGKPSAVAGESLLGRSERRAARLRISGIVPSRGFGGFSIHPQQREPANVFVPLDTARRLAELDERCNAIVFERSPETERPPAASREWNAPDAAELMRIFPSAAGECVVIETDALLIPPAVEVDVAALPERFIASPVINYLANAIELLHADGSAMARTPYSTVAAIDPDSFVLTSLRPAGAGDEPLTLRAGEILLNEWTADDLGCQPGDAIRLTYYVTSDFGTLRTRTAEFTLSGIVALRGPGVDSSFTPTYPGVTDADRMGDWDPPFPVDLALIRPKDEQYWERYRATPKAFITLEDGRRLWGEADPRFGVYTSYRVRAQEADASSNDPPDAALERLRSELLEALTIAPESLGLTFIPVRAAAERAAGGSTDFGGLFIGFSLFLIASAAMLAALLFRLGVERRGSEVGLLLALGYTQRAVRRLLLREGAWIGAAGALLGVIAGLGYAALMLAGLRGWWSDAANAPFLTLSVGWASPLIGLLLSVGLAIAAIATALRGLTRVPAAGLLQGALPSDFAASSGQADGRLARWIAVGSIVSGIALPAAAALSDALPKTGGFFGGGALLMIAGLALLRTGLASLRRDSGGLTAGSAALRLGLRNAARHPLRSMLTAGLIASASFVVISLGAFRLDPDAQHVTREGGSGGYRLLAESTQPLLHDLNTPGGRAELDLEHLPDDAWRDTLIMPFRLRDGDAASCQNLYLPTEPRIIGATPAQVRRGGFRFQSLLNAPDGSRPEHPWEALDYELNDGAIPVIGDEAAVLWQLHSGLGRDLEITDGAGRSRTLRFVALLSGSVLQDELIMSEANFRRLFPREDGYRFFLIEAPAERADALAATLERELRDFGFDVSSTAARLRSYLAVQNTYIGTFQTLGGLGLVLGTLGVAAVLLRGVWERRRELALLQAVGFSTARVRAVVLSENVALVLAGLALGAGPALIAIAPTLLQRPESIPWTGLALTLAGVLATGVGAAWLAVRYALRAPLLAALRSE